MRRVSLPGVSLAFIAVGCSFSQEKVFVNDNSILSQDRLTSPIGVSTPTGPTRQAGITEFVPSVPAKLLKDPSNTPKLNVREIFESEQSKAFEELRRRLRQFYDSEVKKFRLEQQQGIAGQELIAYQVANEKIRKAFEDWANIRSNPFAKLALIAGFPDPNPTSTPSTRQLRPIEQNKFNVSKDLRTNLKSIDSDFYAKSRLILNEVLDKTSADQASLELRIQQFANELDKRAEQEAQLQIRNAVSQLSFKLSEPSPVYLPEVPSRRIEISSESTVDPAPTVTVDGILQSADDRRLLLRNEERIWAGVNRYQLVPSAREGRDATHEFQIWRQQHGHGP